MLHKCLGLILLCSVVGSVFSENFQTCLKQDSISCLQIQMFRMAKTYFDQPSMELMGGVYLTKNQARSGKSLEEIETEEKVVRAKQVEERHNALLDYFSVQLKHLWNQGSFSWNPAKASSILMKAIPNNYSSNGEGRGKQKKQMKMLLPLLIGLKLKLSALAAIGYMGIAIIAKKAILAGLISLLISGFIATKQLIETYRHKQDEHLNAYHAAWAEPAFGQSYDPADLVAAHAKQPAYVESVHAVGTASAKANIR